MKWPNAGTCKPRGILAVPKKLRRWVAAIMRKLRTLVEQKAMEREIKFDDLK